MKDFEIYVHIPFCVRKCNYCDFLSFPASEEIRKQYVLALIRQIKEEKGSFKGFRAVSIYFGGGTPSILEAEQLTEILNTIKESFMLTDDCEIAIEINPGTVDLSKLKGIKEAGFNRISIGMQSMHDDELENLGRIHDRECFLECFANVRRAGFDNVNIDIMTALPGQDEEKLMTTIDEVIKLNPEHVSAYSLIVEENTVFYERYAALSDGIMSEDEERKLYYLCVNKLKEAGYCHYEISNFAKKGYESRHNLGYWRRRMYLGLGLGASSLINMPYDEAGRRIYSDNVLCDIDGLSRDEVPDGLQLRVRNISSLEEYLQCPISKEEITRLSVREQMEEYMFLGLRCLDGVDVKDFKGKFKTDIDTIYGKVINKLLEDGLIVRVCDSISLTSKGIDYGNYVFSQFLF